ncbi:MAG TPA: cysteine--tRNA ligase [Bacilli bacterium]|jgi:cysteinyl-tRNA synthetase|nr:cysteine--tRNA ligase [Bacilli bacterium]HOR95559.1 cysteine--tRNA ligase [Bacilli bacterium]HPK58732.1 cysteine--tRNA ligase [Bacilli bacterium]
MNIKIYNSLTNQIEDFHPVKPQEISIYVCGPTVYNDIHIGNARPVVFFDTVARFFKYLGYNVRMVSNFTDIDDKIIMRAKELGISETEVAKHYIDEFLRINNLLGAEPLLARPRVTEYMEAIINYIKVMLDKGVAYQSGTDVYFRISSVPDYGLLSNQKMEDLEVGSRIEVDSAKEDPRDFVLWKQTDEGIMWDSPFGKGRPGWHTECVVMIDSIFQGEIDIHGGGNDLKFPHHENEIAQALAVSNHTIAKYWVHNARIDLSGEKMSKSLGNVVWAKDVLQKYSGNVVRLMILNNHYRQTILFKEELLDRSVVEFDKIERSFLSLYRTLELNDAFEDAGVHPLMNEFLDYMADDFSTPNAITVLFQLIKEINIAIRSQESYYKLNQFFAAFQGMLYILGLHVDVIPLSDTDKSLVRAWQGAREMKDFQQADLLRAEIAKRGIKLS